MEPEKLYPNIVSVRNTEAILGWTRTSFYSAFIGGIFIFAISRFPIGSFQYTGLCVAGTALSTFWFLAAVRSRQLITYWNECLADLEAADPDVSHPRIFGGRKFESIDNRRAKNHWVLALLIFFIGTGWIALTIHSLWFIDWKAIEDFLWRTL